MQFTQYFIFYCVLLILSYTYEYVYISYCGYCVVDRIVVLIRNVTAAHCCKCLQFKSQLQTCKLLRVQTITHYIICCNPRSFGAITYNLYDVKIMKKYGSLRIRVAFQFYNDNQCRTQHATNLMIILALTASPTSGVITIIHYTLGVRLLRCLAKMVQFTTHEYKIS